MIDTIFTYLMSCLLCLFILVSLIGVISICIYKARINKFSKKYNLPYWVVDKVYDSLRDKGYEKAKHIRQACEILQIYALSNQITDDKWNDDYIKIIIELFISNYKN